ncbi:AMIN-like domain-containing (lipo)protein [Nonomuraea sp. CA-141351]|uniref:AMIN-like domain-containing (lipo)protein n=1 Tax=Nonomuraea sp. CA-141351 TaxID=3239996 RepID=UPI003D8CE01B
MRSSSPPARRWSRCRAVVPLVCLALLTGCGTGTRAVLTDTPSATRHDSGAPTSTAEVDVQRDGMEPAIVTGVRWAGHDTYDRVIVDLKGEVPGYNVRWVEQFLEEGSGKPIDVRGGAYLQVMLSPADAHDDKGKPTWAGGPVFPAELGNLTEVVRTGDFEGHVGIGLVLARQAAFQLNEQGGPSRLIIDVAH